MSWFDDHRTMCSVNVIVWTVGGSFLVYQGIQDLRHQIMCNGIRDNLCPDLEKESVVDDVSETFQGLDSDGRIQTVNFDEIF